MIEPTVADLARGPNFAVLTTLLEDGHPMSHVMWVDADSDHILINTEVHRSKFDHIRRDSRVTVTIIDRESPYHFAEVRGTVVETTTGPEARDHIDQLSLKYTGKEYNPDNIQSERVILKISPRHQAVRGSPRPS